MENSQARFSEAKSCNITLKFVVIFIIIRE